MNNNKQPMPTARKNRLIVRKVKDEVLIYDIEVHQAHCLNLTAAAIWEQCDGRQIVSELAAMLKPEEDVGEHQMEQIVWIALHQLEKAHLLDKPVSKPKATEIDTVASLWLFG